MEILKKDRNNGSASIERFVLRTDLSRCIILLILSILILNSLNYTDIGKKRIQIKKELTFQKEKLETLHKKMGKPKPGEWLSRFREPGQTFKEYLRSNPITINKKRKIIYIQPIGKFTKKQKQIIDITAKYMGLFYNLKVIIKKIIPDSKIPLIGMRGKQFLTTYILKKILAPNLPEDAAVYIGFTSRDLTPGDGWNFVFGQATLKKRVAVWSIYRFGNPDTDKRSFKRCLKRTIKLATHETGHMFSIRHCIKFKCLMNGCNSLNEGDRAPLYLCSECVCKISYSTITPLKQHYRNLIKFASEYSFKNLLSFCKKSLREINNI